MQEDSKGQAADDGRISTLATNKYIPSFCPTLLQSMRRQVDGSPQHSRCETTRGAHSNATRSRPKCAAIIVPRQSRFKATRTFAAAFASRSAALPFGKPVGFCYTFCRQTASSNDPQAPHSFGLFALMKAIVICSLHRIQQCLKS